VLDCSGNEVWSWSCWSLLATYNLQFKTNYAPI